MFETFKNYLSYKIDRWFRRSIIIHLITLVILVFFTTVVGALLAVANNFSLDKFDETLWWAFLRITDPGYLGEDTGLWTVIVGIAIIVAGLVFFGLLITIISSAFQERLDAIKSGHRSIYEKQHTLILGWSDTVLSTIDEIFMGQEANKINNPVVIHRTYFKNILINDIGCSRSETSHPLMRLTG